jgi:multidrug efflux pump subunit AcrB
MPQSVICILFISLLEAFFILPAHLESTLSHSPARGGMPRIYKKLFFWVHWLKTDVAYIHSTLRIRMEKGLNHVIYAWYLPILRYCVKNRYFTLVLGLGCLIISLGLIAGGHVPYTFFPKSDSNWIFSEIVYPLGTPFDTTQKTIKQIETGAFKLNDYFRDRVEENNDLIVNTFSLVGVIPQRDWKEGVSGGHCGIAWIEI